MAWYLKITCYKVTIKISQFSAWFSLRHKLQPALIAPVSIYVVLSISTMVFTTIYEFLESLIENTHTCYTLWLWKMQFSLGKDRPGGVATAPRLKSGQGSLTPGERILCGCPSELTPSRASFCRFLFPLAGSSQSQSFSVSFSLPVG